MEEINGQNDKKAPFRDMAPYDDWQFAEKLASLVKEPGFEHAVRFVMPDVDYAEFCRKLTSMTDRWTFQINIMAPFLETIEKRTTDGITFSGAENVDPRTSYTYISNHRDIVLDASFLNICLLRAGVKLSQVAIGNNLLIYDWISDLVRLNGSFIVKRDVRRLEALNAARLLSGYIHYALNDENESVWIAQREGRAKDSNDRTQEALIKMLALEGTGDFRQRLLDIRLLPTSITYEYDPNDYLKVREYLLRRRDPEYKKCQHDDLLSMETGMLGYKGRVHFHFGKCINKSLAECPSSERADVAPLACQLIDAEIYAGYKFYPINYIAYDRLEGSDRFVDKYTDEDVHRFDEYVEGQLAKVNVEDITDDERVYMHEMFYEMYANTVRNNLAQVAGE